MTCALLSLPLELLTSILDHAGSRAIIRCQMTCRTMRDLIRGSAQMQFCIQLFAACMKEASRGDLSYDGCLRILLQRERAWHTLHWRTRVQIDLPRQDDDDSFRFQLVAGCLYISDITEEGKFCLSRAILPSSEDLGVSMHADWKKNLFDFPVQDVYVDNSQDLLVLVELTRYQSDSAYILHLHTISNNLHHPHAWDHSLVKLLETENVNENWIMYVLVQVAGDHIGIMSFNSGDSGNVTNNFDIWNWRTGVRRSIPHLPQTRWTSFLFLRDDTILLCSVSKQKRHALGDVAETFMPSALQVYTISGHSISVRYAVSFSLPDLLPSATFRDVSIYNAKPHIWSVCNEAALRQIYRSDPDQSVVVLRIAVREEPFLRSKYTLVVDKNVLMSDNYDQFSRSTSRTPSPIPWADWGVKSTRMIPERSTLFTAPTVHGARFAHLSRGAFDSLCSLTVYDFNTRSPTIPVNSDGEMPYGNYALNVIEESVVQSTAFVHPVRTSLPYYLVSTGPIFNWSNIVMDEERIVGWKPRDVVDVGIQADVLIM